MFLGAVQTTWATDSAIAWRAWDNAQFTEARSSGKLVLLDLEAVWCHWCHVMDEQTYRNPKVAALIARHFLPVKVDSDARPDLAERYRDYGWPATVILDADGRDLIKRAGYIEPPAMLRLLQAVIDDPRPEAAPEAAPQTYAESALLAAATRAALERRFLDTHDDRNGGLLQEQKFIDRDTTEYALLRARQGDKAAQRMARRDLDAGLKLLDPVWGGVYQYSTHGDWMHPHYEKLAAIQTAYLRLYALAYRILGKPGYLRATNEIRRYVQGFLTSPDGAIYTSQDADLVQGRKAQDYFRLNDSARRKKSIPRIDTHLYARENGQLIAALAMTYSATGDPSALDQAQVIAQIMLRERALPGGGFCHDASDPAGLYLGDTLAMGQGFLALFEVTGERAWLNRAWAAADFIDANFRASERPGYLTSVPQGVLGAISIIDENIALTRYFNLLARYGGRAQDRNRAEQAMKWLATPEIALSRLTEAGILLVAYEIANDPVHLTVVGERSDPAAQSLHTAARLSGGVSANRLVGAKRRPDEQS